MPSRGKFLEIPWKVIQEAKKQEFGALRSFVSNGRQRPSTLLGTTGGIQWYSIIVILYLGGGKDILSDVATSAGFEPATCPLGGGCSIQLSHEAAGRPGGT